MRHCPSFKSHTRLITSFLEAIVVLSLIPSRRTGRWWWLASRVRTMQWSGTCIYHQAACTSSVFIPFWLTSSPAAGQLAPPITLCLTFQHTYSLIRLARPPQRRILNIAIAQASRPLLCQAKPPLGILHFLISHQRSDLDLRNLDKTMCSRSIPTNLRSSHVQRAFLLCQRS
jgi:hypothetical protein